MLTALIIMTLIVGLLLGAIGMWAAIYYLSEREAKKIVADMAEELAMEQAIATCTEQLGARPILQY